MRFALIIGCLSAGSWSYAISGVGPNGIDATGLQLPNDMPLNGTGIGIGQVEGLRPGKSTVNGGPDDATNSASTVNPAQVFMRTAAAANGFRVTAPIVTDHAQRSASVMISTNGMAPGIAPNALLHASGYATVSTDQRDAALTADFIARRNSGDISAINMSFGMSGSTDASSHLTSFVDWSAAEHDVLYVVSGREDIGGDGPVPSDNYNGITVAGSSILSGDVFQSTWGGNVYNEAIDAGRVFVDLLAPATLIDVVRIGGTVDNEGNGTSIAAPHVTGAAALLQQYAKHQVGASAPRWTGQVASGPTSRRHEVMKAILLNSADKLVDVHGSTRNVFNNESQLWNETLAHSSLSVPLDLGMGAGHLNVRNALTNFETGEYGPGTVPLLGWDYGAVGGLGQRTDYVFNEPLPGGAWVAITLAWDRRVELLDADGDYDPGDEFINNQINMELNNLNLYLMPAGSDNINDAIHASTAVDDSVEHIFFQLAAGQGGDYKIRVRNSAGGIGDGQDFGLAWWAGEVTPLAGDFDSDNDVDDDDLDQWESDYALNGDSDADGDGDSDGEDFLAWQRNYGLGTLSEATAVPEPTAGTLAIIGMLIVTRYRQLCCPYINF